MWKRCKLMERMQKHYGSLFVSFEAKSTTDRRPRAWKAQCDKAWSFGHSTTMVGKCIITTILNWVAHTYLSRFDSVAAARIWRRLYFWPFSHKWSGQKSHFGLPTKVNSNLSWRHSSFLTIELPQTLHCLFGKSESHHSMLWITVNHHITQVRELDGCGNSDASSRAKQSVFEHYGWTTLRRRDQEWHARASFFVVLIFQLLGVTHSP